MSRRTAPRVVCCFLTSHALLQMEVDWPRYLLGYWKRNIEVRGFGGVFQHLSTKNEVIRVEEVHRKDNPKHVRYLQWSFGPSPLDADMRFAYEMKIRVNVEPHEIEFRVDGCLCTGEFHPDVNCAVLHFNTRSVLMTVTYTVLDEDVMSVVVVEVNRDRGHKSLQYGNLFRIDPPQEVAEERQ